jgi:siroheme synthase (precorrin-2 oxidase/ferrochelatase)
MVGSNQMRASQTNTTPQVKAFLPKALHHQPPTMGLVVSILTQYRNPMTAAEVIEDIKHLAPNEQVEVIQFAIELARERQLMGQELGALADQLAHSIDPAEIIRLKTAMTRGFYGK